MDIKKFLPGKKLRRSNRLEVKEKMSPDVKKMGPLGYFDLLPLELKFYIFRFFIGKHYICDRYGCMQLY
jgi:hypothetical protein